MGAENSPSAGWRLKGRRVQTLWEEGARESWGLEGRHPQSCLSAGKPRLGGEFVLGAIGGAGAAGLLSLCSCLIFFT